jgi:hypothetical protein
MLFTKLGLVVHPEKSNFLPSQVIVILGFILNSLTMTVRLTEEKAINLQKTCQRLLKCRNPTIREVARVIGKIVSSFPGTTYGPLYYRSLEYDRTRALTHDKGNFDRTMILSAPARTELKHAILHGQPVLQITSDASLLGWGAECEDVSTGGHWSPVEAKCHINYLEMYAAFLALQAFAKDKSHIHIRLTLDNTTSVSILNHMGTSHSVDCNNLCKTIWEWCITHNIWISAAYLPGKLNTIADAESRSTNSNLEWMLDKNTLTHALSELKFKPDIDLFASRLNKQFALYAAYKPDPEAVAVDAFTMYWTPLKLYAFPPFSVIPLVLNKICIEKAQGIVVIPDWPTQSWYPKALQMMVQTPILLKARKDLLHLPAHPNKIHPLHANLHLLVCLLSGKP